MEFKCTREFGAGVRTRIGIGVWRSSGVPQTSLFVMTIKAHRTEPTLFRSPVNPIPFNRFHSAFYFDQKACLFLGSTNWKELYSLREAKCNIPNGYTAAKVQ